MSRGALVLMVLVACGGEGRPLPPTTPLLPLRAATVGDMLMAYAPAGADVVLELDLARLRANPVVGPTVALVGQQARAFGEEFNVLRDADAVLLASYDVGAPEAVTLTLVSGGEVSLSGGLPLADGVRALGPPALLEEVQKVRSGAREPLADDVELAEIRATAMPEAATGAALRIAARLDFDARVGLASMFDLDAVPVTFAVWGDVADDLAIIALMSGTQTRDGAALASAAQAWRAQAARQPWSRALLVAQAIGRMEVAQVGAGARAVLVIGPSRLERLSRRMQQALGPEPKEGDS